MKKPFSNAVKIGDVLRNKLEQMMQGSNVITEVRGRGLMIGVQVKTPALRDRIIMECFRCGVLVLGAGASTIRLSPPLIVDEEQAEFAVQTLSTVIAAVA